MDKLSAITRSLAKKYTDESVEGAGAIKGKNCQIQSIEPITGGNRVTFAWYDGSDVLKVQRVTRVTKVIREQRVIQETVSLLLKRPRP